MSQWRYEIPVVNLDKALRLSKDVRSKLKNMETGLGKNIIAKMRKEAVECPILKRRIPFLQCLFCTNFLRRVKGIVYCKGEPF